MYTVDFNRATVDIDRELTAYISFFANVQRILVKNFYTLFITIPQTFTDVPQKIFKHCYLVWSQVHLYDPVVSYPKDSM